MRQRVLNLVGDVLDERAAEHHVQKLLAAADAEHRQVAVEGAAGNRRLEGGAAVLGAHRLVARVGAEQGGIEIEGATGDQQRVDAVDRKSVVEGKGVSVRVDLGGSR